MKLCPVGVIVKRMWKVNPVKQVRTEITWINMLVKVDLALSHNSRTNFFLPKSDGFGVIVIQWRQDGPVLEHDLHANEQATARKECETDAWVRIKLVP